MASNQYVDSTGATVRLGAELGKGGEGAVFEVHGRPGIVAKVYFKAPEREKADKIAAMAAMRTERIQKLAAWPVSPLRSPNGVPAGFLMPKVSGHRPLFELYGPKLRLQRFPRADWRFLIHAAMNTARAFAAIHEAGHVIGDVNHGNLVVAQDATVCFIDTDSFQITSSGKRWFCEVGVATHQPPEMQGRSSYQGVVRTPNHDCFGLAVLIFQMLCMARHPFSGRFLGAGDMPIEKAIAEFRYAYAADSRLTQIGPPPGSLPMSALTPQVVRHFERAFSRQGLSDIGRPTASEWISALQELAAGLKQCRVSASHFHLSGLSACPWCEIETKSGFSLFPVVFTEGAEDGFDIASLWRQVTSTKDPGPAPPIPDPDSHPVIPSDHAKAIGRRLLWQRFFAVATLVVGVLTPVYALQESQRALAILVTAVIALALFYIRPTKGAEAIIYALRSVESDWIKLKADWMTKPAGPGFSEVRQSLTNMKYEYENLPNEFARSQQKLWNDRQQRQLAEYLDKHRIENAGIKGIGDTKAAVLQSYNIETAGDVSEYGVMGVPGFGPVLAKRLVDWRRRCERRFIFDPKRGISPSDIAALKRDIALRRQKLRQSLLQTAAQLSALSRSTQSRYQLLQDRATALIPSYAQARADAKAAHIKR